MAISRPFFPRFLALTWSFPSRAHFYFLLFRVTLNGQKTGPAWETKLSYPRLGFSQPLTEGLLDVKETL